MSSAIFMSLDNIKSWIKPGESLIFLQQRIGGRLKTGTNIGKDYLEAGFSVRLLGHPTEDTWDVTSDVHSTTIEATLHESVFSDFSM